MGNNKKILHICSYYIGTELYQNLFNSLGKIGLEQDIYVFVDKQYKVEKNYPSNVYISKCYNKIDRYIFHLKHGKVLKDIKRTMDLKEYGIVHAHSLFSNGYIAYKLKQQYGLPYIVAVRNTDVNVFFTKMLHLRMLGVNILKGAEKVIFISQPYKEYTIEKFIPEEYKKEIKDKSVVIPNGIDDFWLKNKYRERMIPKDNMIRIIYVGVINANKNIETTTKACKLLIEQGYDVKYKIVGKIVEKKYHVFIKKYPFIEYVPFCKKEDLIIHYRSSDVFVMPSKYETFGLVYAEAMSQGLPVIYTRGQGFDGQFEDGVVGYSVNCFDAQEIANKVVNIINRYEEHSRNCIKLCDKFDWDKIAHTYINIYNSS